MFKKLWEKKLTLTLVLAFIIGGGYMVFSNGDGEDSFEFAEVEYVDITQEVSVTGTIEADPQISLRFQRAGQVESIPVDVGDFVAKGTTLASLDATALAIEVDSAEASLALARANYNQTLTGSTDEAIQVAQAATEKAEADLYQAQINLESVTNLASESVESAELDYESALTDYDNAMDTYGEDIVHAYEDAYNTIKDAMNEVEDSLREADNILGVDNTQANDDIETELTSGGTAAFTLIQSDYTAATTAYDTLLATLSDIETDNFTEMDVVFVDIEELIDDVYDLLNDIDDILVETTIQGTYTLTVQNTKRDTIAAEIDDMVTADTTVSNAIQAAESAFTSEDTNLGSAQDALNEAEQALALANAQAEANISEAEASIAIYEATLSQKQASQAETEAGPRDVDLASLLAAIQKEEAALSLAQYNLSLAYLTAPIAGPVTKIYFDVGENVTTTEDFLEMVSSDYQVIANISETDITKVKVGDQIKMTLDAFYYDKIFEAEIIEIDPAETVVQGVIYYQVTAVFTAGDTDVKPGMTANMDIITAETNEVLGVPIRAVKYDGTRAYVLQEDKTTGGTMETDVTVGIRGDQYIEVLGGLEEGDKIITYSR